MAVNHHKNLSITGLATFMLLAICGSNPGTTAFQADGYSYVRRLSGALLDKGQTDASSVKEGLRGCARRCSQWSQCVAFNYGTDRLPAATDDNNPANRTCQLIGVSEVNSLAQTTAVGYFYYEMNCDQFCFSFNAELKVLPCLLNLSVQLRRLPKCNCDHLKAQCPLNDKGQPLLPIG